MMDDTIFQSLLEAVEKMVGKRVFRSDLLLGMVDFTASIAATFQGDTILQDCLLRFATHYHEHRIGYDGVTPFSLQRPIRGAEN